MSSSLASEIIDAFERVHARTTDNEWVRPYNANKDTTGLHQLMFFLKPEATDVDSGANIRAILDLSLAALANANVDIGAVRVLGGEYLDKHDIMTQHYGVISKISKQGVSAISEQAKSVLEDKFKDQLAAGAEVLGGQQFLAKFSKEFTPFSLLVLNDNLGTTRLAGGTYLMNVKVLGKPYLLLNPFHAYQLVPYTTPGHAIIVFECLSRTSWAELRGKVTGVTDPKDAAPGSIRNQLLQKKDEMGLKDVDKGTNGVHMSAGPLEGMVELTRFMSDPAKVVTLEDTCFGSLMLSKGISAEKASQLASNIVLDVEGKKVSSFDLTEENDSLEAVAKLAGH